MEKYDELMTEINKKLLEQQKEIGKLEKRTLKGSILWCLHKQQD